MRELIFHPGADAEFEEAMQWYRERNERAAEGFNSAVDAALADIQEHPERWPQFGSRHRHRILKKYPYYIVYKFNDERIDVMAIAHAKRKPGYWSKRS